MAEQKLEVDATNAPKIIEKFEKAMKVFTELKNNFPSSTMERMQDVKSTVYFLTSITFFPMKGQVLSSPPCQSGVVEDCVKNSIHHTYKFLFANCDEVYKQE
ncbi:unnamed protein product [Rotaria sp. Silwood1]|nr:unnamed protein product [Rotaria sp. Silwood1]